MISCAELIKKACRCLSDSRMNWWAKEV